ncbi:hypothetical protein E2C01_032243 [Portunus trituberculatus]|uniref:Uncharacterized protein n=1 Tax=Portunus trituberculatus TaxID=210409 RepID=A0A5B7EUV1_PORTR|nr:hypothetical protein [Portunus trituberculatus]
MGGAEWCVRSDHIPSFTPRGKPSPAYISLKTPTLRFPPRHHGPFTNTPRRANDNRTMTPTPPSQQLHLTP